MFSFVYTLFTNRAKIIKYEIIHLNHLEKNLLPLIFPK
jgi:hypothetical protein